ncbi:aminotransferase class I/II-fold pyridoxal phosphate-dependent enzyme [Subsaximicrobium wynnwilliamsii]|uniref:Aminotransferase class I/II-fold pyridoxal phosphate-dependent enzyme n=1 Tax=Subsaximicrobium wynnwilliamsii TaxID=291179 RepID=A0A5C6ZMC0_9FLAO|nr:aminotransferase class I/II-fold pyridoxal phosphate-dependent enzyme [Subsaximicrobium wynnwilliamsii]TXD84780.1 aminotransferase class I/II-fold pyridoxal phosphate-dependent enzyme [Subsaximicrobium wynnwilliamsii]TXD90451.1 aminotransferase class I/II-fold pyridoxal phosphate-dependent enzyme [Subsaximicrobium wynnwilliamsii]TXE04927.1 aminotransferase class I/II-fold pyridoxal phosphate-dependent enzyme [Subsaximicrobium wynnwilliamsii]
MPKKTLGLNTICTHVGEIEDKQFKGAISPIYMSTSYEFDDVEVKRYPRYFNTPNQEHLAKKIAALEHTEAALIFGSGMAAISTMFLAFLKQGDHIVVQNTLYGGTSNFIREEFPKYGIEFTFTNGYQVADFEAAIQENTKVIYIETPSNPLLTITDIKAVADLASSKGLVSMIDNTFASPINQTPIDFGIDLVMHSATKYLGGHSDILAGAVAGSSEHMHRIWNVAKNLGGSLSDMTVWMLERSMKTLALRVKAQNKNALKMAKFLNKHDAVANVFYPGLKTHPEHALAKSQMKGFGGMLSFELVEGIDAIQFQKQLQIIKSSMSLAGVESTMLLPCKTSHALLSSEQREAIGISDRLIRFSVGIETFRDLKQDISQAIARVEKSEKQMEKH